MAQLKRKASRHCVLYYLPMLRHQARTHTGRLLHIATTLTSCDGNFRGEASKTPAKVYALFKNTAHSFQHLSSCSWACSACGLALQPPEPKDPWFVDSAPQLALCLGRQCAKFLRCHSLGFVSWTLGWRKVAVSKSWRVT